MDTAPEADCAVMKREHQIEAFLRAAGWHEAVRQPITGDMSYRRYERLLRGSDNALLMDAPPEYGEDCIPFEVLCRYLKEHGFSTPEILAADLDQGFMIIEDLGNGIYARLMEQGSREEDLYELAIDTLIKLQKIPAPSELMSSCGNKFIVPSYTQSVLVEEVQLFAKWFLPAVTGRPVDPCFLQQFVELWRDLAPLAVAENPVLVHRDYHAENIMLLPERQGVARLGILDFQDGVTGHPAYDLVSLLEDARRDVDNSLAEKLKKRFLEATDYDVQPFNTSYAVIGAQRNLRIVGVFARYWLRRGIDRNLKLIPRVFGYIEQDLQHPALAGLKEFLDLHVPESWRYEQPDLGLRETLLQLTGPLEDREP